MKGIDRVWKARKRKRERDHSTVKQAEIASRRLCCVFLLNPSTDPANQFSTLFVYFFVFFPFFSVD